MAASTAEQAPELTETDGEALPQTRSPHRFTRESAREAGKRSGARRRQSTEPPSDEAIERGLRERATTSAKDAEVLLRWLARPRIQGDGLGLDAKSEEALEGLYKGLLALAELEGDALDRALGVSRA